MKSKRNQRPRLGSDMLSGPILPGLISFAIPIIFSGILQKLYSTADTLIVGAMGGKEALAAVGATGSTVDLLIVLFVSIFVGTDILIARAKGNGDEEALKRIVSTTYVISLAFGVILLVMGEILAEPMMILTDCPSNIIDRSTLYLRIYFLSMPASMFTNFASSVIRSSGNSRSPFIYLGISGLCNVIGNVILILTLGNPVVAVAASTTISVYISAILFFIHMVKDKSATGLHPFKFSFHPSTFLREMRLGIPSAISSTTFSIANLIIQPIVNSFGDVGISGTAACGAIESYIFVITQSVGNTVGTFLGQNIGARNKDRVKKILIRGYTMNFVITAVLSVIVISIGKVLLGFFIPGETEAIEFGYLRMWIIIGFSFLNALANINRSALQAYGYTFMQMISNLMAVCLFSVLWVLVIYDKVIAATPFNFLISYPISWLISVSVQLTMVVVLTKNYLKGKEFKI